MTRSWRMALLAFAYWGGTFLLAAVATFFVGDCGTGPAPDDLHRCLAEKALVYRAAFGLALVGFPFFLWRLHKEKGPL